MENTIFALLIRLYAITYKILKFGLFVKQNSYKKMYFTYISQGNFSQKKKIY